MAVHRQPVFGDNKSIVVIVLFFLCDDGPHAIDLSLQTNVNPIMCHCTSINIVRSNKYVLSSELLSLPNGSARVNALGMSVCLFVCPRAELKNYCSD